MTALDRVNHDYGIDEGFEYRVLSRSNPIARKEHRCVICDKPIAVGERHQREAHILEGSFYCVRSHNCCLHGVCRHLDVGGAS